MRVLILLDSFVDNDTGIAVFRLLQRLVAMRELVIQVASLGEDGPLSERLRELGLGTRVIPWGGLLRAPATQQLGQRLFARSDRPDIIMSFCAWPALGARFLHGGDPRIPLVLGHLEAPGSEAGLLRALTHSAAERATRNRVSAITVLEEAQRERLQRQGYAPAIIHRIQPGIDALQVFPLSESGRDRYRRLVGVPADVPLIVFAGRPHADFVHDAAETVVAMARVRQKWKKAVLFLVGEGLPQELLRRAGEHEALTRLIGPLSELHGRLNSSADVLICSTPASGFPRHLLESQASGAPVIALRDRTTGTASQPDPFAQVVSVERRNAAVPLAEAIELMLESPRTARDRGERSREHVMEHFELSTTVEGLLALWRELAPEAMWRATDSIPLTDLEEIERESTTGETRRP